MWCILLTKNISKHSYDLYCGIEHAFSYLFERDTLPNALIVSAIGQEPLLNECILTFCVTLLQVAGCGQSGDL